MKYYKGIPSSFSPVDFIPEEDSNPSAIFYFRFSPDGFFSDPSQLKLKNMISGRSRQQTYALDGRFDESSIPLENILTKNLGEIYKYSSLNWTTSWDGICCKDDKNRLYFEQQNQYAKAEIMNINETKDLTVEFWFMTNGKNSGTRSLLTVTRNGDPMLTVMKDTDGGLRCYPFFDKHGTSKKYTIEYFDFEITNQAWYHVSCIIDSKSYVWGTIFRQNQDGTFIDNAYINHFEKQDFKIDSLDKYEIILNSDVFFDNGMDQTFYSDVRIWKTARTWHQIKEQRNQIIDFKNEKNLFAAFQLLGGGRADIDMASIEPVNFLTDKNGDEIFKNELKFQGAQWKPAEALLIMCPLLTYVSYKDKKCYRDGLQELDLVVRKDTKWHIDTKYSHFVDDDLRKDYAEKFSFQWTLVDMIPSHENFPKIFNPQKKSHSLVFDFDKITQGGTYFLKLDVKDEFQKQQATITKQLRFEPQSCIKFHDKKTSLTYVEIDVGLEKGSQDLYYQFLSEVTCTDNIYSIDRVTYSIDFIDYKPKSGVYIKGDWLVINKQAQQQFPVDADILIILRASQYSRLDYSIVYNLRFNSKVKLQLSGSTQIVPLGETLGLFTNKTTVINYPGKQKGSQWSIKWTCPKQSILCPKSDEKTLSISHQQFLDSALQYWQSYTFSAESTSYFIQGDSTLSSFSSISVIWIPFYPDAKILGEDYISVDQVLALEIDTNGIAQDKIRYLWKIEPPVNEKYFFNGKDRREFFIEPNVMAENTLYEISVEIILKENSLAFWQGKKYVQLNPTPADGKIVITPYKGVAMETEFLMETSDWIVRHEPAEYQFMYQNSNGEYSVITPYSSNPSFRSILPPTKKIIVKVRDSKGFIMIGQSTIFSQFQNETKTLFTHTESFEAALLLDNFPKLQQFSLISNNFNKFSSFQGFYTSKMQSALVIKYIDELKIDELPEDERTFSMQSAISIFCTVTFSENLYTESEAIIMQQVLLRYMQQTVSRRNLQDTNSIFKDDFTVQQSIIKTQSNILQAISNQIEKEQIQNLIHSFKDSKVNNITENLRKIIINLEQDVSGNGQKVIQTDVIKLQTFTDEVNEYGVQAKSTQKGSFVYFGYSPYLGSGYLDTNRVVQEVYSNFTVLVAIEGTSEIEVTFDYLFQREKFDQGFEEEITHCVSMNATDLTFNHCSTQHFYSSNKITCTCSLLSPSFLTVSRDEYLQPLSEAQGNFDFKNWASFIIFTYLMLLFIFGMILSQNKDQQDIAKMNDFDQGSAIETTQIQFPLSALALKRQVQIMNFAHTEITYGTLFVIYLTQFHPFFSFQYRFDPNVSRQDRFLQVFTKISVITFGSFWFFRGIDKEINGEYKFPREEFLKPAMYMILFSILVLPFPQCISRLFEKKYLLTELPDNFDETGQLFGKSPDELDNTAVTEPFKIQNGSMSDVDETKQSEDHSLFANPNIPLKYLFQISAFSLEYLRKKGHKRFPFLTKGLGEIGLMLDQVEIQPKIIEMVKVKVPQQPKKKDKKKRHRRRNLEEEKDKEFQDKAFDANKNLEEEKIDFDLKRHEEADVSDSFTPMKPFIDEFGLTNLPQPVLDSQASLLKDDFYEGGSDSSDPSEPLNKEFVENSSTSKIRICLYVLIAACHFSLLAIYSKEAIHSRGGQYIWVAVAFGAQIIGFFFTHVLHIALMTLIVYKNQSSKVFLCRHFYDQLVILEDYFYVQKFQNKF